MWDAMEGIVEAQKTENHDANEAIGEAATGAADWVDHSAEGELTILSDFLEKGFSYHVDTTNFIQHTAHPYAPFSTGAYNELADKINGLEQFFGYWKRTKEGAIDTLDSCKALEKSNVYADVFEEDCPALNAYSENLIYRSHDAANDAIKKGDEDLADAKEMDLSAREAIETRLNKDKAKIFREIGYQAKKLYRVTREEYKHEIKQNIEDAIVRIAEKIMEAREDLAEAHKETFLMEVEKDE